MRINLRQPACCAPFASTFCALGLLLAKPLPACAAEHRPAIAVEPVPRDGLYGRFNGPWGLAIRGGPALRALGQNRSAGLGAELEGQLLESAGVVAATHVLGGSAIVTLGGRLRPLFPALFFLNLWTGHARFDLVLQSLFVEFGAVWAPLGEGPGVGWTLATGLEIPLMLPRGPWRVGLQVGARHWHVDATDLGGPRETAGILWDMTFLPTVTYVPR